MKNRFIRALGALSSIFVMLVSCSGFSNFADARIVLPDTSGRSLQVSGRYEKSDIAKYLVVVNASDADGKFEEVHNKEYEGGGTILLKNLDASFLYGIRITALTGDGIVVAEGSSDFTLEPGRATDVSVKLKFIDQNKEKTSYIPLSIKTAAGDGEVIVTSFEEISAALNDAGVRTIILGDDVQMFVDVPLTLPESKTFDGNGHAITLEAPCTGRDYPNSVVASDGKNYNVYTALFGNLQGVVKNLKVNGTIRLSGKNEVAFGGLAVENSGTILNCESNVDFSIV